MCSKGFIFELRHLSCSLDTLKTKRTVVDIFAGPVSAWRAARLLFSSPRLIAKALIPAVVTCSVSIIGIILAIYYGDDFVRILWSEPESKWLHWAWWLVIQLVRVSSVALAVIINPWLVILFGISLSSPLSAAADESLGGHHLKESGIASAPRAFIRAIVVALIGLTGSFLLFSMGLVPGLGIVTASLSTFVWTPLILAFDLFDGTLGRRAFGLRSQLNHLFKRPLQSISVGLTGMALLSVPFLNLFGLPIAVVMGVIMVRESEIEFEQRALNSSQS